MRIIVTGGAGFIGSNIVDSYIAKGHRVGIIDDMSHGFKVNIHPKAEFYKADIRDLNKVRRFVHRFKPNVINHHAAIAEVVKSVKDPVPTMEVNVQGTINMLLTGGEVGIKKFIFSSTGGAIYGNARTYPIAESAPTEPLSPYGLSKLLGEHTIHYYARMHNFNYLIFRYPNVYGPRQDPHGEAGVVAIFTQLLQKKKQPTIFGDGSKTRDYTYVKDIAKANIQALHKGNNVTINLGHGKEISDQMVYDTIASHFPESKIAKYKPVRSGEAMRSSINAKRAGVILGWKPTYSFANGIAEYVKEQQSAQ